LTVLTTVRSKLSFANVTSCLALFVALGGTGYAAVTLPRNSVGPAQLRPKSVGGSELRTGAVSSRSIKNGSVATKDLTASTRAALRGQAGPQGPAGPSGVTLRASVPTGGTVVAGNAVRATHQGGTNEYTVDFPRDLTGCIPVATLAAVQSGPVLEQPEAGRITLSTSGVSVLVKTYRADGAAAEQPFNLVVAC
jgi:hypothetical protein